MGIPKYESLPRFSDDPEQNAEMTMEYMFECRIMSVDPYYVGDTDDDYIDYHDELETDDCD